MMNQTSDEENILKDLLCFTDLEKLSNSAIKSTDKHNEYSVIQIKKGGPNLSESIVDQSSSFVQRYYSHI